MPRKQPKKAPRSSNCRQPQTKNRPYLWLHGSKCDSEGTYSTRNPPRFVVSTPQNCPNGRLDPNNYREQDSQMADLSFRNCILGPKTAIFGPIKPWNTFKTAKRRETVGTLHVPLDFPVSTSSLQPSNSMICRGSGPKRPPEAPTANSHKPRIGHIFGYMAQNAIPRAPTPPATPHVLWFPPLRIAQTDA